MAQAAPTRMAPLVTCAAIIVSIGLRAQAPPVSGLIAFENATVVVGDGRTLDRATVVVRAGLIESVGTAAPPPGARVVDLKGSILYPGFIDTLTEQGLRPRPAGEKAPAPAPGGVMAHVRAADLLESNGAKLAAWRDAGVLAFNVSPDTGIFMGQTAVVTLGAGGAAPTVVRGSAAMRLSLRPLMEHSEVGPLQYLGPQSFPSVPIGVIAHVRQTLLDAQHQAVASEKNPALDALVPVVQRALPLIVPAQEERHIRRVVDLSEQFNVTCIVAGGYEAVEVAAELNRRKVPVLISLNFPQQRLDNPAADEPVRDAEFRQHAPRSAADLAAAHVPFAFYSDGLPNGRAFLQNLRLTVRYGLSKDAALRAATLTAAEILGVDRQLGSIEPGKIANFIVADRDLFDDAAQIRSVVARGEIVDVAPVPAVPTAAIAPAPAAAHVAAALAGTGEILFTHANILTVTHGTLRNTSLLVRGGKISAIGAGAVAGPRTQTIAAADGWITPGLIDAHSHIPSDSHNETARIVMSMANTRDTLDPSDISMYRVLAGGVTTVQLLFGSVDVIGGQNVVIKMRWGKPAPGLVFDGAKPTIKFALGENPKYRGVAAVPGGPRRYPATRMGVEDVIRAALNDALGYRQTWADYEQQKAAGGAAVPPRRDLTLEPLVEVLEGRRLVQAHSYRADEMLMLMRVAEEYGFRIGAFHHANEAYKIASEIAKHGAGASVFADQGTGKIEQIDSTPYNAAILMRHGVVVSINSDSEAVAPHLNQEAAKTMKYGGLTENEALATITLNPAKQLGIDTRVGSIDTGKDADLVLFRGHPMSVYGVPEMVLIDGEVYFSRERDRERQKAIDAAKQHLSASPKPTTRPGGNRER